MPTPSARRALDDIPVYRPGKPAESDELKLSSNENPYPPLPGVMEKATEALGRVNRYPDAGVADLYAALARTYGLPQERFAASTGSVAVLFSLLTAFCEQGDEIIYAWRSFEAYPIGADLTGARTIRVPLRPDATHDLDAMAAAVTEHTRVVIVCTPNNPTGPVATHAELERFVEAVPDDVIIVVDEAYVEFVRQDDAASGLALADHENVIVLRTFSKAFGLAGLRVGYAIAAPSVAESIRKAIAPFSVTDVAQAAAVASLDATDALAERVETIVAERARVLAALRDQGWDVPDSQANFVWLPLGDDSLDFAAACDPVSVRPFAGDGVRVTIGDPDVNDRFLDVAERWLK
ncbi:histidinol-phosphate transaminase [Aeromicrobium sp.]|uniref:histidinol-phosphate transaminase n=1 Tax=Aeromicrobium sp. TaxID=1871063 RepID=UPI003D6B554B